MPESKDTHEQLAELIVNGGELHGDERKRKIAELLKKISGDKSTPSARSRKK